MIKLFIAFLILVAVSCVEPPVQPALCTLEPDPGPCKAYFERYFFNENTGKCEMFIWGGCDGVVPFETMEECKICIAAEDK